MGACDGFDMLELCPSPECAPVERARWLSTPVPCKPRAGQPGVVAQRCSSTICTLLVVSVGKRNFHPWKNTLNWARLGDCTVHGGAP